MLSCEREECHAVLKLTPALLTAINRGYVLEANVQTSSSRETLDLELGLTGFTNAHDSV
ncbi:invasion associated locus B family protein [Litoreibacter janthinus]|uniref:invasion associated locus B family protein n=1 Tax=Litoreibacter janthinus TaxID=670154 RepID=UPI000B7DAD92